MAPKVTPKLPKASQKLSQMEPNVLPGTRFLGFGEPLLSNNTMVVWRHLPCSQDPQDDRKRFSERMWPLTAFFASPVSAKSAPWSPPFRFCCENVSKCGPQVGGGGGNEPTFSSLFRPCSQNGSRGVPEGPGTPKVTKMTPESN